MFSGKQVDGLMTIEASLLSFVKRVNDAYVASQTIHDLIGDYDYQKLTIKSGKGAGIPLGNQHILPGYWFTVFVAPYESFKRVLEFIHSSEENEDKGKSDSDDLFRTALERFRSGKHGQRLLPLIENFRKELDTLVMKIDNLDGSLKNSFPKQNTVKRFTTAIASGCYDFSHEDDLRCTFFEHDSLCGYRFELTIKVSDFNQLAMDFSQQLVQLLWPVVEGNRKIRSEVDRLFIGEIFLNYKESGEL